MIKLLYCHRDATRAGSTVAARLYNGGRPLSDPYALVEHGTYTSHTRRAHVGCSFDTLVRVHTLYEIVWGTFSIRYQHDEQSVSRLEHVGGWLTGAHVQFWTCWWVSHTVFTRSRHTARCDCSFTTPFCGELTVYQWIFRTKASVAKLWYFLWPERKEISCLPLLNAGFEAGKFDSPNYQQTKCPLTNWLNYLESNKNSTARP